MLKLIKNIKNRNIKKTKKNSDKVDSLMQQVKQGPYYIFTICHRNLYQRSVRLCKHEKYNIVTPELYHPVNSFDETVKHVISILIKMKFHVKLFAMKW